MIINIRGTSGSGKTTVVKDAMQFFTPKVEVNIPKRRNPLGYWFGEVVDGKRKMAIPGHYATACGGCDTLSGYDEIFNLVRLGGEGAQHVLFEGLLVSEESKRTLALHERFPSQVLVIELTTSQDECLASVQARREARGNDKPLNPANTVNRMRTIRRVCDWLQEQGVAVEQHNRASAAARVRELLHG